MKRQLLAASMQGGSQFDARIQSLGLGVAALFNRHCNRDLGYLANAVVTATANRAHLVVPRYPLVEVTSVGTKTLGQPDWTVQASEPQLFNATSGIVYFSGELGDDQTLVKVTYTGGYWFDQDEPDAPEPGAKPEGAYDLPDDLRTAFLLQCGAVWSQMDKLGTGLVDKPGQTPALQGAELLPLATEILRAYIRYQIS